MNGYVMHNLASEALGVFHYMLVSGSQPDEFCIGLCSTVGLW